MTRRQFLAAFAACVAARSLPPLLADRPFRPFAPVDPWAGGLWAALYELDPGMGVQIDYHRHVVHLRTRADFSLVQDALWWNAPIGVLWFINGRRAEFEVRDARVLDALGVL